MLMQESDLAQRAVWILQTLYEERQPVVDPMLVHRVLDRLGSGEPECWGKFKVSHDLRSLLAEHARSVCQIEPQCETCELRKFCGRYRDMQHDKWKGATGPTVVDLFCGAGGASAGFVDAGFKVLLAVDVDGQALQTYRLNHPELPPDRVIQKDLSDLENSETAEAFRNKLLQLVNGRQVDVVVGGPPCQGFSQIGTDGRNSARSLRSDGISETAHQESGFKYDPKNRLYLYFLMIVDWLQPRFCVMENVPAMIQIGGGRIKSQVVRDFEALGYHLPDPQVYRAVDYGVPQRRERALFLACREAAFSNVSVERGDRVLLGEAIRDLPRLNAASGSEVAPRRPESPPSTYARSLSQGTTLVHNHVARPHMNSDLKLYGLLGPGESIKDKPDLMKNRELFHYQNATRFRDIYKRQSYAAPSSTVIAHLSKDGNMFIHPEQVRTYTVREAARVQSFTDDFIFCGSRTAQFRQIGNAIPPRLIRPFADFIATILGHREGDGTHQAQMRLPI